MILVTIGKIQSFLTTLIKKVNGKTKNEHEGKIIDTYVGLKIKMYSIKNADGKESNTAKVANNATEF